ncbi:hypothetical protein JCM18382A_20220 [Bradyrhizobium sp. 17-4]
MKSLSIRGVGAATPSPAAASGRSGPMLSKQSRPHTTRRPARRAIGFCTKYIATIEIIELATTT